jgi:hypothetical protein
MRGGEPTGTESLDAIRERTAAQLGALPSELRGATDGAAAPYPVRYSDRLAALTRES